MLRAPLISVAMGSSVGHKVWDDLDCVFMCYTAMCLLCVLFYHSVISSELELLQNIYPNELVVEDSNG